MENCLPNDEVLISRLLLGDEKTYKLVVRQYHKLMNVVASAIVGNSISEEVVQDSWVAVIKSLPKFERRSSFKTWLLTIVSNNAKTRVRRESRKISCADPHQYARDLTNEIQNQPFGPENYSMHGHYDSPSEILEKEELHLCVSNSINLLPPMQKSVLTLIDIQGLDNKIVCDLLDVNYSNMRVILHRARSQVFNAINDYQNVVDKNLSNESFYSNNCVY